MNCPRCGCPSGVVNTRPDGAFNVKRQRKCEKGHVFHTTEMLNAAVHKPHLAASNAAAVRRVSRWHRDIDISRHLYLGADLLVKAHGITRSAVYVAARRGRAYARK